MKKLLLLALVAVAAIAVFKYLDKKATDDADRKRVEDLIQATRDNDEQKALCLWALNRYSADADTMRAYYDAYLRFVEESGMRVGTSWSIREVTRNEDEHATLVTVAGQDRQVVLRVKSYVPIELAGAS
jgi:ADP-glucose pyrophosphorylase